MDRSALTRTRPRDAPQPVRPSTAVLSTTEKPTPSQRQAVRGRSHTAGEAQILYPTSGKIRKARDSSEITRAKRGDVGAAPQEDMTAAEDDRESQHFTVGGVGAGGTLYLTPSRQPTPSFSLRPPTSSQPAERVDSFKTIWPSGRASSDMSLSGGNARIKGSAYDHTVPVPPISLANINAKRRPRSHSFSTIGEKERSRASTVNSTDIQDFRHFLNGGKRRSHSQRPQSSLNLGEGLLKLHIPHYKLGTPRFSDRGTAYLHNSIYTMTTDDANSSMFSRPEFDNLFPAPPGATTNSHSRVGPRARDSNAPVNRMSWLAHSGVRTFVFEKIQANPNDPATVRFSAQTGKIAAATPARLVAQITSPDFLDYELLSDFFLTYRGFLSPGDLLEFLLARMRWALGDAADSGRIARVRTFVALRHWILNYFSDDFLYNYDLRQRFCDLVNQMCSELSQRPDKGGGDLNILSELKKCWRRHCATFWQDPDALDTAPDAIILPGGDPEGCQCRGSLTGPHPPGLQDNVGESQQAALAPQVAAETGMHNPFHRHSSTGVGESMRSPIVSMQSPGSPMSDLSFHVVSCSMPFFSAIRPSANPLRKVLSPKPAGSRLHPPKSLPSSRPSHQHKRSGSFSDALRDERTPLPSAKIDSENIRELPNMTLTAGLARGLILQPSTAQVQVPVLPSPAPRALESRKSGQTSGVDEQPNARNSQQHMGVKRIVGDMRRVLSTRRPNRSPARSNKSGSSSGSKPSEPPREVRTEERPKPTVTFEVPKGPIRHDLLGEAAARAYQNANQTHNASRDSQTTTRPPGSAHDSIKPDGMGLLKRPDLDRVFSQVTASSQSIMIVDATGPQEMPVISQSLPSVSTWSCTMTPAPLASRIPGHEDEQQDYFGIDHAGHPSDKIRASHNEYRASSEPSLHGLITLPEDWRTTRSGMAYEYNPNSNPPARKSSGVQSPIFEMPPIRNPIRRVPGGDLKNVGHVHDLESEPRVQSSASMSTLSRSLPTSYDLTGTHFSGQCLPAQITSLPARTAPKESLGLLDTPNQPYIRKSIKEDAWRLAKMNDNSPGGGGVEDALLKLEGRYAGRRASTQGLFSNSARDSGAPTTGSGKRPSFVPSSRNGDDIMMGDMGLLSPTTDRQGASIYDDDTTEAFTLSQHGTMSEDHDCMYEMEEFDDNSMTPVLQRATMYPIPSLASGRPSYEEVKARSTMAQQIPPRDVTSRGLNSDSDGSRPAVSQMSFLLGDNESLSDSEISTEITDSPNGGDGLGVRSFFFDDIIEEDGTPRQSRRFPSTPPATAGAPHKPSPEQKIAVYPTDGDKEVVPTTPGVHFDAIHKQNPPVQQTEFRQTSATPTPEQSGPAHLPFVFAYSSSTIAEQLTIIEKDALDEIDWKDLIGLDWHQNPPPVRNWVSYLRSSESDNGIDLVIARFNLVVKWVVSEIVLTSSAHERARAITKFIHVASHSLRLKNYASTYQITLALLSTDVTRLKRTWRLVPSSEKTNLARLERLCQPVRNFAALRTEMEAASLAHGCIPFIGLYTHDLMYNAQKPARINPAPPGAPTSAKVGSKGHESLINFERYQTSAAIAKGLLRLLESSARYALKPESECLSRCLWLAALDDQEIAERSRALE
ncbi:hypothetical protein Q7P37_010040 [Cladosporium fusiforme]